MILHFFCQLTTFFSFWVYSSCTTNVIISSFDKLLSFSSISFSQDLLFCSVGTLTPVSSVAIMTQLMLNIVCFGLSDNLESSLTTLVTLHFAESQTQNLTHVFNLSDFIISFDSFY